MPPIKKPTQLTLRTYQVGFGDCFLLTFHYGNASADRHVLIDFGSTRLPDKLRNDLPKKLPSHLKSKFKTLKTPVNQAKYLAVIAEDIRFHTGGKLHIVVGTHRHKDHIDGFKTNQSGTASGNIIAELEPELVVLPWTEHPEARTDAAEPPSTIANRKSFVAGLGAMQRFAGSVQREAERLIAARRAIGRGSTAALNRLSFMGENNLSNKSAVKNLLSLGKKTAFVNFGAKRGQNAIEKLLPGVKVHILGPPTITQSEAIRKQRPRDEEEFWHFAASAARRFVPDGEGLFPKEHEGPLPIHARWLGTRMDRIRLQSLMRLVRILDNAMNNTSVILLFEAGRKKRKLLFPGDAQIENWSYALFAAPKKDRDRILKLLEDVDLYKVGHHGSLNATPKSLWERFGHRCTDSHDQNRLTTVVSTQAGVHGHSADHTEVPRTSLLKALKAESHLLNTDRKGELSIVRTFDL